MGKSSLQNDVRDRIEQPWRTTKPRNMMKHQRPSIRSQYQRIEGQSPPRTFRDSKKIFATRKSDCGGEIGLLLWVIGSTSHQVTTFESQSERKSSKERKRGTEKEEE